jgi:hypothetical protein
VRRYDELYDFLEPGQPFAHPLLKRAWDEARPTAFGSI